MKYFCIDTSGAFTAVGACGESKVYLADDGKIRAGSSLMPMLDSALNQAGMKVGDADFAAVVIGPGSFTGIRIGVSTVRALCYALNIPAVPVNSCELAAYNSKCTGRVLTVSDAGNGFCFTALYDNAMELSPPACMRDTELAALIESVGDVRIAADPKYAKLLGIEPTAGDGLTELAMRLYEERRCDYSRLEPLYVRKSQAEEDPQ